jgi:hypothetical protein
LVLLAVFAALTLFGLVVAWSHSYWWDRDQWNQVKIAKAYVAFYASKTNFPNSLADLVLAGYLPEKAEWYKEPPGFFTTPVNYTESSYVVLPPPSGDVDNLDMIGRRTSAHGHDRIDFSSPQNAVVRDKIKRLKLDQLDGQKPPPTKGFGQ